MKINIDGVEPPATISYEAKSSIKGVDNFENFEIALKNTPNNNSHYFSMSKVPE